VVCEKLAVGIDHSGRLARLGSHEEKNLGEI
jgi:hypothetical protein